MSTNRPKHPCSGGASKYFNTFHATSSTPVGQKPQPSRSLENCAHTCAASSHSSPSSTLTKLKARTRPEQQSLNPISYQPAQKTAAYRPIDDAEGPAQDTSPAGIPLCVHACDRAKAQQAWMCHVPRATARAGRDSSNLTPVPPARMRACNSSRRTLTPCWPQASAAAFAYSSYQKGMRACPVQ